MPKAVQFRDNPDLDMGRYQIPGYTGHFPGKNCYMGTSMGKATKCAMKNGGYFQNNAQNSTLENNRPDNQRVQFETAEAQNWGQGFQMREQGQGGQPIYTPNMIPGYTGHIPCKRDKIGRTFRRQALDGTMEFERIKSGAPRFRIDLPNDTDKLQSIGTRASCNTGNIDRDKVPIDLTVPLYVPRFMGHHRQQIIAQPQPPLKCFPGFEAKKCSDWQPNSQGYQNVNGQIQKKPCVGKDGKGCKCDDKGKNPPIYREVNLNKNGMTDFGGPMSDMDENPYAQKGKNAISFGKSPANMDLNPYAQKGPRANNFAKPLGDMDENPYGQGGTRPKKFGNPTGDMDENPYAQKGAKAPNFGKSPSNIDVNPYAQKGARTQNFAKPLGDMDENPYAQTGTRANKFGNTSGDMDANPYAQKGTKATSFGNPGMDENPYAQKGTRAKNFGNPTGDMDMNPYAQKGARTNNFGNPTGGMDVNPYAQRGRGATGGGKQGCSMKCSNPLQYSPNIIPTPQAPDYIRMQTKLNQPTSMKVSVPMPTWSPTMAKAFNVYNVEHAKSGFAGFLPGRPNVLGASMNRAILGLKLQPPRTAA